MKRAIVVTLLGLGVTAAVIGGHLSGALSSWERRSIDERFRTVPRRGERMTDEIVHVDIDDGALDGVGRWPWDRSTLAAVLDELSAAGARTIALDLILTEKQQYPAGTGLREIDHDAVFAAALGRVPCVLAVDVHQGAVFGAPWRTGPGAIELEGLLDRLGRDIEIDVREAARGITTRGLRRRFLRRPLEFKRAAAWLVLSELAEPPSDFEAFEHMVAPARGGVGEGGIAHAGTYPEEHIVRSVWEQDRAWRIARPLLLDEPAGGSHQDRVPLPSFVGGASQLGSVQVTVQKDPDGSIREVAVAVPATGGSVLQFGLAAAVLHLDVSLADIERSDDLLRVGDTELPLHHGNLWIDWPSSSTDPRWEGFLQQSAAAPTTAGHLSIGAIVSLAQQRARHAGNLAERARAARQILQVDTLPAGLTEDVLREVRDQVAFDMEDYDAGGRLTPEDRVFLAPHLAWRRLDEELARGEDAIRRAAETLRIQVTGKLVFVGWTATSSVADFVSTAAGPQTPGVVVHAVIAHMVLTGRGVRFLPTWADLLVILTLGFLSTLAAARLGALPSALVAAMLLGGYTVVAGGWLFTAHDLVMPLVSPVTAGVLSWVTCTALQAALSQRERQRITRQFKARVSMQLVDHLIENPEELTVSGEERELTVLLTDLTGFTAISERLGGRETVSTLNRYMNALTQVVIDQGAYMNKFLGDGFMAFWSAFAIDPGQAAKACVAALECHRMMDRLNADPQFAHIPRLGLRIGVATGRVVVGDCGAPPALNDYTVIGDAVNLAARLESANKQFGTRILMNGRTRELMGDADVSVRPIGRVVVVGQTVPVDIYEVLPTDAPNELIELSERLVRAYGAADFEAATACLDELDDRGGPSPLTTLYRESIARRNDDFDGTLHLRDK